jgi:hypothetical protein
MVRFAGKSEWEGEFLPHRNEGLVWYTGGSKTNKGSGAGIYGYSK